MRSSTVAPISPRTGKGNQEVSFAIAARPGGETGIRKGLKIPRPQGHAGSSPAPGTRNARPRKVVGTNISRRPTDIAATFKCNDGPSFTRAPFAAPAASHEALSRLPKHERAPIRLLFGGKVCAH